MTSGGVPSTSGTQNSQERSSERVLRDSEAAQRSLIHHAAECGPDDIGGVKAMGRASRFSNPGWTVIGAVLEIGRTEFDRIRQRPLGILR